jgi:putative membrane protein
MSFISEPERQRIADAVRAAERRTSGEIVTVIAGTSGRYHSTALAWAAILALALPLPLFFTGLGPITIYEIQVGTFAVLALLLAGTRLRFLIAPAAEKEANAARVAREQFYANRLHLTGGRTGVLLFVSIGEHQVHILADKGIDDRLPPGSWDAIIADFVAEVKAGRVADGFVAAIAAIGAHLQQHFPAEREDLNELPDPLVEI